MVHNFYPEEILKNLPLTYYVINHDTFEILKTNHPSFSGIKSKCYNFLFEKEEPCSSKNGCCICNQLIENKEKATYVIENVRNNKKEFFRANASSFGNSLALVFYENITELVSIQKELKINSKRLERAEKLANFGYWEFNIDDKIMFSSRGAANIYGVKFNEMTLADARNFTLKKYRKLLNDKLLNLIDKGEPYNVQFKIKRKSDGDIRCIHSIAEYREDKRMVFGVIHDITGMAMAQESLAESEGNMKQLFENMNSAFAFHKIVTDKNGVPIDYIFLDVNPKFEELTGLKSKDIINKRVLEIMPETEKFWIEIYGEVALSGKPVSFSEYSEQIGKFFEISAYSPRKNYFAVTFSDITQKVKSERALNDSLMDLKMAQRIAKFGNWKYNPEKKLYTWSNQVYKIMERDPAQGPIDYFELENYFLPDDYKKLGELIDETLFNQNPFEIQLKLLFPEKRTKWIEIICQPGELSFQNEYLLRGTVQDITVSKIAEEEINKSNQLLRTVIDNIPDAVYLKDVEYRKLISNFEDARRCGFEKPEEVVGKFDSELYPTEVVQKYFEDDRKVIEKGETIINKEEFLPGKNGNRIILTSKFPLKNDKNEILGLVGIGRDITEIKENASTVNLLQQTVEQTPLSILISNSAGIIKYVNSGFSKISGFQKEEVIGNKSGMLKSGYHDDFFYKNLWETITSGKTWYGEFYNKRKSGELYWESAVIAPIFDEKNEIMHFVAIKEDITEQKQMIDDLKIAKIEAEESCRLKSLFLNNMSHEIRTPLNGILGFSNIICSGIADKNKLEYYGKIMEKSGRRLIKMVDDIIDISMLQSNQMNFSFSNLNLNDLMQDLYISFDNLYNERKGIDFNLVKSNDNSFSVLSDKNKLSLILNNLIDNAFKFTESGKIEFGFHDSKDAEVTLFVKDTGIGIAEEKRKIIFEAFRQAEEGNARKYEGSGLGLAVVAGILEKMGGKISVESEPGRGTIFYIKLYKK